MPCLEQLLFPRGFHAARTYGISRPGGIPGQSITDGIRQRPEGEASADGLGAVDSTMSRRLWFARRDPQWQFHVGRDIVLYEQFLVDPREVSITSAHSFALLEQLLHGQCIIWSRCMIDARVACFDHAHDPLRQVAHIDELYELIRLCGHQYFAPLCDTMGPVGKAIGGVMWAD